MSDEIHITPAEGQSAAEVAEVFAKAAEAQGLDTGAIEVDGTEVIVPQEVAASLRTNISGFPPKNQTYSLQGPVSIHDGDGQAAGVLDGFGVIVNE